MLTWERINSYKKKVFEFQHLCVDEDHLEKVKSKQLDRDTLLTTSQITAFSQIEVIYADVEKLTDCVNRTFEEHGVYLFPATVADFIEEQEMELEIRENPNLPKEEKASRLTDLEFITKYASHLSKHHGETLLQRIEFIENNLDNPDVLAAIDEFIDACDYGLKETVKATCKECGASQDIPMSFDVLTFFP